MWLLPLVAGAVVPHAPLLLGELDTAEIGAEATELRAAVAGLDLHGADAVVVATPHSRAPGVYASVAGDLGDFGIPAISGSFATAPDVIACLETAGLDRIEGDVDHGVLVPALIGDWSVPIVGVGVGETPSSVSDRVAAALRDCADGFRLAVVASAHGSAALSDRAPLTFRPEARRVEARFLAALQDDVGAAAEMASELSRVGGSCGGQVFRVLGDLFEGRAARVTAYRAPVGVGYLVAEVV
ncbi:MAG TPA: hypothetical protein VFK89_05815 [Actinomycetota bacterium]|nr:hypothetical protein [Actinomycetota bacterium]